MVLLQAERLVKRFGGLVAVQRVDLLADDGEVVGLIGPNGSGKTTVFNLLTGFLRPDGGRVRLHGRDVTGRPPHEIARLGLVRTFQDLRPFHRLDVQENLRTAALPTSATGLDARRRAHEVMDLLDLRGVAHRMPGELPTGYLKMLEVGKALAAGPRVLLLDEPYAGLTPQEMEIFTAVLRRLLTRTGAPDGRSGLRAIVLIEHVMRAIMDVCHRVAVLHHGEKIAEGSPAAVARDPAVITAYLGKRYAARPPA